jgi:hypothetical protein
VNISPETLTEEEDRERAEREKDAPVFSGRVSSLNATQIPLTLRISTEVKSRVVRLTKPFDHCQCASALLSHLSFEQTREKPQ